MAKNPYNMLKLGKKMAEVREKICLEHEMQHALELMEMLVAGKIIDPDLEVKMVYEKVWWPHLYK